MNSRERFLTYLLLGLVCVFAAVALGYFFYWSPLQAREFRLKTLREDWEKRDGEIRQIRQALPKLERWKQLSLPADLDLARREYEGYLTDLLRDSGFIPGTFTVTPPRAAESKTAAAGTAKGPNYTRLKYTVSAPAALGQLVTFLERFYRTNLLHRIQGLNLKRGTGSAASGQLTVELTIEALALGNPESRIRPVTYALVGSLPWAARMANGPVATSSLAVPPRQYAAIAANNIFLGPPPAAPRQVTDQTPVTRSIYLTSISLGPEGALASLHYQHDFDERRRAMRSVTVRPDSDANTFPILEDNQRRTLVEGVVLRMDERDLFFRVQLAARQAGRRQDQEGFSRADAATVQALLNDKIIDPEEKDRLRREEEERQRRDEQDRLAAAERKKRAAEALAYNGLVQSWPEIVRLAREGEQPRAEQGGLFGESATADE